MENMSPKPAGRMIISATCANQFIIDFSFFTGKNEKKRPFRSMESVKVMYTSTVCYN
jgi:hypothetical protein